MVVRRIDISDIAFKRLIRILDLINGWEHGLLLVVVMYFGLVINRVVDLSEIWLDETFPLVRTLGYKFHIELQFALFCTDEYCIKFGVRSIFRDMAEVSVQELIDGGLVTLVFCVLLGFKLIKDEHFEVYELKWLHYFNVL